MDLRHLHSLLAVAEHGSFSAAARATHTVQSNVSTHIARLEGELGARLVDRGSGRLTDEGEAVASRARRIRSELEAITADLAAMRDEVTGTVRMGMIGSIGRWLVPGLLREVESRYPGIDLVVVDATTTSLLPQISDGSLDAAVVNLPVSAAEFVTEPLFVEERVLVAPVGHEWADNDPDKPLSMADLGDHPLVLEPPGTAFRDDLDRAAAAAGIALDPLAEVDGMTLVTSLALGGFGPAILPATALVNQPVTGWCTLKVTGLAPREVGIVRRRSSRLSAPARTVGELLVEIVSAEAPTHHGVTVPV